jgi:hypothetical protein
MSTFRCAFCDKDSGFGRRKMAILNETRLQHETRTYECENADCGEANDITLSMDEWDKIDGHQ